MYTKFSINTCIKYDCPLLIHNSISYSTCKWQNCKLIKQISKTCYLCIINLLILLLR